MYTKAVVSLDWLAIGVECIEPDVNKRKPRVPAGFSLVSLSGTAVWNRRQYLLDKQGEKVATLLFEPKSKILSPRRMVVEIANRWLYDDEFAMHVNRALSVYSGLVTSFPRVDICCDFELYDSARVVRDALANGEARLKGVRSGSVWWKQLEGSRVPHCMTWGAPDSMFHWKLYWKWFELHESGQCSKPYIEWLWEAEGMKPSRVWRLECSISDAGKLRDDGHALEWYDFYAERVRLFCDLYQHRFVVRMNDGHSNASRDRRVWLFEIDDVERRLSVRPAVGSRLPDSVRSLVGSLWKQYRDLHVQHNSTALSVVCDAMGRLLQEDGVCQYLQMISGYSINEIHMRFPLSLNTPPAERDRTLWMDFGEHIGERVYPLGACCPIPERYDLAAMVENYEARRRSV